MAVYRSLFLLLLAVLAASVQPVDRARAADWPTAGGNLQRTRSTSEQVNPPYKTRWVRHFNEEMIAPWIEPIVVGELVYVATSKAVVALEARSGEVRWRKDLPLPAGHAPTVVDGVLYVGCMDRHVYALSAQDGSQLWQFRGGAGFATCPAVTGELVIVGCRDGKLYALDRRDGQPRWTFVTGGPILYTPACGTGDDGREVVYLGSNDMHAYALDAATGRQIWKSPKLPGRGMHAYWPVVGKDKLVFAMHTAYPGMGNAELEKSVFMDLMTKETPPEKRWKETQQRLRAAFEQNPSWQTMILLDRRTGQMGPPVPAPYVGEGGPNRTPVALGPDGRGYFVFGLVNRGIGIFQNSPTGAVDLATGELFPVCNGDMPGMGRGYHSCPGDEPPSLTIGGSILYDLSGSYDGPWACYFDMEGRKGGDLPGRPWTRKQGEERTYLPDSFGQPYRPMSESPLTDKSGVSIANGLLVYNAWNSIVCVEGGK